MKLRKNKILKPILKSERGFVGMGSALAIILLGLVASSTGTLITNSAMEDANSLNRDQAEIATMAGAEYALRQIDQGGNPVVIDQEIDTDLTFSVSVVPPTITVMGRSDIAEVTHSFTTEFANNCVALDCTGLQSVGNQLLNVNLLKTCLSTPTLSDFRVSITPNEGELFNEMMVNGISVFDQPGGSPSGTWLNTQDYTFPEGLNTIPINSISMVDSIEGGKTYTFTARFSDTSEVSANCVDLTPPEGEEEEGEGDGGSDGGGGTSGSIGGTGGDTTPNYEVDGGVVTIDPGCSLEMKVLCAEITYGQGGPEIEVRINRSKNDTWFGDWMFDALDLDGGEIFTETNFTGSPATYKVKANAKYGLLYYQTYYSTDTIQVKTLIDGDTPPPLAGFGGQKPVSDCIDPYLNDETGLVELSPSEVIMLFELGVNLSLYPDSLAADFQDAVVLLTIDQCS